MKEFLDWLRMIVISLEAKCVVAVVVIAFLWPDILSRVGERFIGLDPKLQFSVLGMPFVLLVGVYKLSKDIRNPGGKRAILLEWPNYWKIKNRVKISLFFSGGACLAFIVGWYLIGENLVLVGSSMSVASILVSIASISTVALGRLDGEDEVDKATMDM